MSEEVSTEEPKIDPSQIAQVHSTEFTYEAHQKYDRMFRSLDTMRSFVHAAQIAELGHPKFTTQIPTAGVGIDPHSGRVIYLFNPEFYFKLCDNDLVFVQMHEVLHVTFKHPERFLRALGKDLKDKITEEDMLRRALWNKAADCIVNIWCVHLGFQPSSWLLNDFGLIFPETIGFPHFGSSTTVEEIYVWLQSQDEDFKKALAAQQGIDDHGSWVSFDGPIADQFSEDVASCIKEGFFKKVQGQLNREEVEDLKKKANSNKFIANYKCSKQAGREAVGELRQYENLRQRVQTDILRRIHVKIKSCLDLGIKETWTRPPKKLITMWPSILLPSDWDQDAKEKFRTLLAIDSSGSITDGHISQFVRWARSFPMDKIEYHPMAFDNNYYTLSKPDFYNPHKYPEIPGRGGTDISLPEAYINEVYRKKMKCRPDLIIVLTDGEGSHDYAIPEQFQHQYLWVMVKGGNSSIVRNYCPKGVIYETNIA